jgi:hypothetical protein
MKQPSVSKIRKYTESFLGLSMKDARARLRKAKLKRSKWENGGFGGAQLTARFQNYEFRVMFYNGKAITVTFSITFP